MWYNIETEEFIESENHLWEVLKEIACSYEDYWNIDNLLDELYEPVTYLGVNFYPSQIVKNLDSYVYKEFLDEVRNDWVDNIMYVLMRLELERGWSIAEAVDDHCFPELEKIIWKEIED